jgi:hypothetical protein
LSMNKYSLSDAVQKIVQHIAETGKPRAKAIRDLWKELALPPATVKRMAQRYLLVADYDFENNNDCRNHYSLVGRSLDQELEQYEQPDWDATTRTLDPTRLDPIALAHYQRTNPDLAVLDQAQVQQALAAMVPLFGGPGRIQRDGEPGQRLAWPTKTVEQALWMCTVLKRLGLRCFYYKGRWSNEVLIYGPWTEKRKLNQVLKKLDNVA